MKVKETKLLHFCQVGPFSGQFGFLEAPLVWQADGELKNSFEYVDSWPPSLKFHNRTDINFIHYVVFLHTGLLTQVHTA